MKWFLILMLFCSPCYAEIYFDGTNDVIDLASNITVDEDMSISFWVWQNTTATFMFGADDTDNYCGAMSTTRLTIQDNDSDDLNFDFASAVFGQSDWVNVIITKDSSSNWNVWVDGVASLDNPITDADSFIINQIGQGYDDNTYDFVGRFTEMYFFNKELSATDRLLLQNSKLKGIGYQIGDVANYYPFNDFGDATTTESLGTYIDRVGGNTGTVDGTVTNYAESFLSY